MKVKGTISCGRVESNTEPFHFIQIVIEDELSGIGFLSVKMSYEEFGKFVSGGSGAIDIDIKGVDFIGKTREWKRILMPRPEGYGRHPVKELQEITKPFEVDGWIANIEDLNNHHNWRDNNQVEVLMTRYVNTDKTENVKEED
jgi:hypothetical protein